MEQTKGQEPEAKLVTDQPDFRVYPGEMVKDRLGRMVEMKLCEELIEGRWEAFYSIRTVKGA